MKRIIILVIIIFLGLIPKIIFSQCLETGISTNPNNPVNPQRIDLINSFDWITNGFNVNSSRINGSFIDSPFFQDDNSLLVSFFEDKDRLPEDGWELIKYDLGRFDSNGNPISIPTGNIYIALYNKYTSILRVFVAGNRDDVNGIEFRIKFDNSETEYYTSALSSVYNPTPLYEFETNPQALSVSKFLTDEARWHYADFYIEYDPCTCFYESLLAIEVRVISTAYIELTGSLSGTVTNIDDNNSQSDPSWSFSDALDAGKKASKTYSSIGKWVTAQERALKIEGKTEFELELEGLWDKLAKKKALNRLQQEIKSSDFLKAGFKAAPYIGAAFELVSFFIGGGKKSEGLQEVKIMPMSIQADIKLNGTITQPNFYKDIFFYTPGSLDAENKQDSRYPLYNEVLGVMNIMKTPKAYSEALIDWICVWGCFGLPVGSQLKLTEGIEYVLNPAAGFKPNPEIEMAWRIEYPDGTSVQSPLILGSCFSEYTFSSSALIYPDVNVYVKVFANLEREDADGNTQNVLWVSEYPVELQSGTPPAGFFYSGAGVISPNTTSIEFTQTNPTVIGILSGNNTYAWKDMTISVEMIAQSFPPMSFPFVLGAGGEINLEPGAIINTGLELRVFSPTACQSNLAPAHPDSVQAFCESNLYKAPRLAPRPSVAEVSAEVEEKVNAVVSLYPNPTTNHLTIETIETEDEILSIDISDMYGTRLASWYLKEPMQAYTLQVAHLLSGVYICHIQTRLGYHTKRFVIE